MGRAQNPKPKLPDTTGAAILRYIMREKPYKKWGTWKKTIWNRYDTTTPGENPHGKSIRIYANEVALNYSDSIHGLAQENPELPVGSIVMKENFRSKPSTVAQPSDLVELTIMYKALDHNGNAKWFWVKAPPYGPVDMAGFNSAACISCHMNWKGNADGMLLFNFDKRPVITTYPYQPDSLVH